jgi:hypothetical protein
MSMTDFLDCAAAAAKIGLDELRRLQLVEILSRLLSRTARSPLPDAVECRLAKAGRHRRRTGWRPRNFPSRGAGPAAAIDDAGIPRDYRPGVVAGVSDKWLMPPSCR